MVLGEFYCHLVYWDLQMVCFKANLKRNGDKTFRLRQFSRENLSEKCLSFSYVTLIFIKPTPDTVTVLFTAICGSISRVAENLKMYTIYSRI